MQNVLFTETQRKKKYDVCSTLGKKISLLVNRRFIFLINPPLRKRIKILSFQNERGTDIQKTHTAQTSPTRTVITKAKHMTTDPANNSKVTTTRDINKRIKGNGTYRKARNI